MEVSKRILVCGGRTFGNLTNERDFIFTRLERIAAMYSKFHTPDGNWLPTDIVIITGMARGVDTVAYDWAVANHAQVDCYPADWNRYGNYAGPIRNKQMLEEGKPDLVLAFPGGRGTDNMKQQARRAGVMVVEVDKYE